MFQEGNYDVIEFNLPREGMNQFISPEVLPPQFCYYLENILPTPLGSGEVRYGTRRMAALANVEAKILELFPFIKTDGSKQALVYVQEYTQDVSAQNFQVIGQTILSFNSAQNAARYIADTPVKIQYTLDGANRMLYAQIEQVSIDNQNNVQIVLGQSFFPAGGILAIQSVWYATGSIYSFDFGNNTFVLLKSSMSVACIPRSAYFQQTLLICNGVDRILSWDGASLQEVVDFVKERQANTFNYIDNQHFSFVKGSGFDASKYFAGNLIQLRVNGITTTVTIASVTIADNLVTIATQENIPQFAGQDRVELFYRDWPPRFNYIYAGTDRLWALGEGAAGIQFRTPNEALRVYYSYEPNTVSNWFNENTKTVPSIDMSDKQGIPDNFEAVCQVNGLTAFLGRSKTQVWRGTIPGAEGDFQWQENLPVGVIHGNLLVNMPNDVYFVSQSGLQSFSTLNIAKQFAATSSNAVDPMISSFLKDVTSSNINYRACKTFKYEQGTFGGFKLGQNKVLVSPFQTQFYAWSLFAGDFQRSRSFVDMGRTLCLAIDNALYQYADGNDGSQKLYSDNNGTALIPFTWIPGLISMKGRHGRRFANKRYELIVNYPSSFALNPLNKISISITGNIPRNFQLASECEFQVRGDVLGEVPMGEFRLYKPFEFVNKKLKFVSSQFWVTVSGYTLNGPLVFKKLRLFGVGERNG